MMDATRLSRRIGQAAAVIAAAACMMVAVSLLHTVEKAHRLAADIAASVGPAWGTIGPADQTTRTAPVWAGMALVLAAASGALLAYAFLPRPAVIQAANLNSAIDIPSAQTQ